MLFQQHRRRLLEASGGKQLVNYVSLFSQGEQYTDLTGGWAIARYDDTTVGANITMYGELGDNYIRTGADRTGYNMSTRVTTMGYMAHTQKMIDVSPYTKLYKKLNIVRGYDSNNYNPTARVGFSNSDYAIGSIANRSIAYSYAIDAPSATGNSGECVKGIKHQVADITEANLTTCVIIYNTWPTNLNGFGLCHDTYELHLFKPDDVNTLGGKIGMKGATIDEILAESSLLLTDSGAVNFMLKQCTGDFMISAIHNETFMSALETSPHKSKIESNEHWAKFLAMKE